jgi:DNA-binding protein HU-beta
MTQAELAAKIAEDAGVSRAAGVAMLKSLVEQISKSLKKGEGIRIAGLGTFRVAKRGARTARNPRTGEAIKLKASKQPKFSASATLKKTLNPVRGEAGGKAAKEARASAAAARTSTKRAPAKTAANRSAGRTAATGRKPRKV